MDEATSTTDAENTGIVENESSENANPEERNESGELQSPYLSRCHVRNYSGTKIVRFPLMCEE